MTAVLGGAATSVVPVQAQETITKAQAELPTSSLVIRTKDGQAHHFTVELAKTPREQEVGEMFRTSLPKDRGMLFLWPHPQVSDMWMRNTLVPLDIVFIDATNHVHAIVENAVPRSEAILSSQGEVANTLELAGGVTAELGIQVGDEVSGASLKR
ncbi:hypothetical protein GMO_20480 [Gluconobacter morbifer G707]|uniref:DUF192 domain-containing protein n=1 Tax=Gluconobacter morbifer G707 TaxID=1088869 RepID=G6XKN2_9PROT|nr:hypothetical protein GMO_20480 [Gluconobacter morbifer G707]